MKYLGFKVIFFLTFFGVQQVHGMDKRQKRKALITIASPSKIYLAPKSYFDKYCVNVSYNSNQPAEHNYKPLILVHIITEKKKSFPWVFPVDVLLRENKTLCKDGDKINMKHPNFEYEFEFTCKNTDKQIFNQYIKEQLEKFRIKPELLPANYFYYFPQEKSYEEIKQELIDAEIIKEIDGEIVHGKKSYIEEIEKIIEVNTTYDNTEPSDSNLDAMLDDIENEYFNQENSSDKDNNNIRINMPSEPSDENADEIPDDLSSITKTYHASVSIFSYNADTKMARILITYSSNIEQSSEISYDDIEKLKHEKEITITHNDCIFILTKGNHFDKQYEKIIPISNRNSTKNVEEKNKSEQKNEILPIKDNIGSVSILNYDTRSKTASVQIKISKHKEIYLSLSLDSIEELKTGKEVETLHNEQNLLLKKGPDFDKEYEKKIAISNTDNTEKSSTTNTNKSSTVKNNFTKIPNNKIHWLSKLKNNPMIRLVTLTIAGAVGLIALYKAIQSEKIISNYIYPIHQTMAKLFKQIIN